MITSPAVSFPRNSSTNPAWRNGTGAGSTVRIQAIHSASPTDPSRQANRLPIRVLKMLAARAGHLLHPEYLQPLPSTPISPIELDAKKSPLALLAQTCSQIGKPDPPSSSSSSSSKLSSGSTNGSNDAKESTKSGPLRMSDIGAEDKSSFKPYAKTSSDKKDAAAAAAAAGDRTGYRVPSATCQPFSPRTGSPGSCTSVSPLPSTDCKPAGDGKEEHNNKKDSLDGNNKNNTTENNNNNNNRINSDAAHQEHTSGSGCGSKAATSDSICVTSTSSSVLGSGGLVAPVSPYKPGHPVFPLPHGAMSYPGSLAGAYASYHHHHQHHQPSFLSRDSSQLLSAQFASSLGCGGKAGGSPLAGASPPSLMSASLCRDPYCLSYHCASHLASTCGGGQDSLKSSAYPLAMYPAAHHHPLLGVHPSATPSFAGHHPLYPYGFMLPNDPLPHVCNWVSANGPCDKRFPSSEELLGHLRTHTAFAGAGAAADKLMSSGYASASSLAAAAAMAASPNGSPGSPLGLRSPHNHHHHQHHHALGGLGLSGRYHPYSKSPLPPSVGGPPVQVMPGATGAYYSPYALYGQRLTTASVLGYQ
ncbi:hypothetical protein CRUP_000569 [Coryphaenoides rupestris]|nr:hypothetical protein CRUP_030450 [Coryphaenoides rupestris]KAG7263380.1 hypothetical protein CRUP_000569 [Coryphaenoides rupestris]